MMAKRIILFGMFLIALTFFWISSGITHSNSAPNFECIQCHEGKGSAEIRIDGLPKKYVPGETYKMALVVKSDVESLGDNAGGFAIEASAGELKAIDKKNTQLSNGILTHTNEGSALRKWTFWWKAPLQKMPVDITVMAVAVNGDFSVVGDLVGADTYTIMPIK